MLRSNYTDKYMCFTFNGINSSTKNVYIQNNTDDLNAFHKNQSLNKPSVEDENDKQWFNKEDNAMEKDDERLLKWATQNCRNVGRDVYFKGLKDFDRKHQYNGRRPDGEKLHSRDSLNRDLRAMDN